MMHKAWRSIEVVPYWFFKVIYKISRSHRTKNRRFQVDLNWVFPWLWRQFEFTHGFEMLHTAWHNIDKVPYCFSRSSFKFRGLAGWKINDFNQIWLRLLGWSQLSNPSDRPRLANILEKYDYAVKRFGCTFCYVYYTILCNNGSCFIESGLCN